MKIFHRYADKVNLTPTQGDLINEIQIVNAMRKFATVTKNPNEKSDLYYTRACPKLFLKLSHPKVCFASPYNKKFYNSADAISTFSSEWTKRLKAGTLTDGSHIPDGKPITKPVITVQQVLSPQFKPLQNHPETIKIRKSLGGGFIIGQFGKMRATNIPHSFLNILPGLKKEYPQINVVFSDMTGMPATKLIKLRHFSYDKIPYVLSACDLLLFPYWALNGHFSGALRIKEAMGCGVPIITAKFNARVEELGKDYKFYHPVVNARKHHDKELLSKMRQIIVNAITDEDLRKRTGQNMVKRAEFYSVKNCANRMESDFKNIIG